MDYLRLLFLFHINDSNRASRIQALIQLNTKKDLTEIPTYVRGKATTSIKLWFIPSVMKALNIIGVLDGHVEGGYYEITKEAVMAY